VLGLLGLPLADAAGVLGALRSLALTRAGLTEADVAARIADRAAARAAKEFARSDEIRDELAARGVLLMDTAAGSAWRPGLPVVAAAAAAAAET
jgi:cysteinyl-tRNA synthetase